MTVIQRVLADGSGRIEEIGPGRSPAASGDGAWVLYTQSDKEGIRLWYRSLTDPEKEPAPFLDQAFYSVEGVPSPDGHYVAYEAESAPDSDEVYLRRFPPSEGVWQISARGGRLPRWSRDGRLYFADGPDVYEVEVATDPDVRLSAPKPLFTRSSASGADVPTGFDVSPDGKRFLIREPAGDTKPLPMVVTLNLFVEFAQGR